MDSQSPRQLATTGTSQVKFISPETAIIFLAFLPIPLGLLRTSLNIAMLAYVAIGTLAYGLTITREKYLMAAGLTAICLVGTATHILGNEGSTDVFSLVQAIRVTIFLIFAMALSSWGARATQLFKVARIALPVCLVLLAGQAALSNFVPGLANIQIGSGESSDQGEVSRSYIYPYAMMYAILPFLLFRSKYFLAILATFILAATGSRQAYLFIVLAWVLGTFTMGNPIRLFAGIVGICITLGISIETGALFRFQEFFDVGGDQIRKDEAARALSAWSATYVSQLFGIGLGTPYWEGWAAVWNIRDADDWILNSAFDVHNGFVGILLRFGILGSAILTYAAFVLHRNLPRRLMLTGTIGAAISLTSSSGFYTNEIIAYTFGIALVRSCLMEDQSSST